MFVCVCVCVCVSSQRRLMRANSAAANMPKCRRRLVTESTSYWSASPSRSGCESARPGTGRQPVTSWRQRPPASSTTPGIREDLRRCGRQLAASRAPLNFSLEAYSADRPRPAPIWWNPEQQFCENAVCRHGIPARRDTAGLVLTARSRVALVHGLACAADLC